ncbi:HK97 family phage prohead protease [Tomitella fengzijianii]|uniref:HK97 family phage prohead protease n=2 Tax=Tomitella fengzijianii TaxID=2597660 RepID=A0A516X8C0_9ACTN|nr:HK97 family phage prohead protease [Tomitella fengzijianii]
MYTKASAAHIKAGPDDGLTDGTFTAYASVFGNVDSYGDVVMPGAFADTLTEWKASGNPIPLLFGHNMSDPDYNIGAITDAVEDDHGLKITAALDLDAPKAAQVYRLLKGKRINQMSFAYDVLDAAEGTRQNTDGDPVSVFELRKLHLHEVSVVPIGANDQTEVLAVKTAHRLADRVRADGAAGRVIAPATIDELKAAHDAFGRTLATIDSAKASNDGPPDPASPDGGSREKASPTVPAARVDAIIRILEEENRA